MYVCEGACSCVCTFIYIHLGARGGQKRRQLDPLDHELQVVTEDQTHVSIKVANTLKN